MPELETPVEPTPPVEETENQEPTAPVVPAAAPVASGESSAADDIKNLRDRFSQEARERKRLEQLAIAQGQQIQQLSAQLDTLGQSLSRREQAEMDAYLQSLPVDKRLEKKLELLERKIERNGQTAARPQPVAPVAPQQRQETQEEYTNRRVKEILAAARQTYGVEIDPNDEGLDYEDEKSFVASVRAVATTRKRYATPPAPAGAQNGAALKEGTEVAKQKESPADTEAIVDKVTQKVMEDLGVAVGRSNSPRAVGAVGDRGGVTSEHLQEINRGYSSARGPRANLAALRESRDKLEKNLSKGRR